MNTSTAVPRRKPKKANVLVLFTLNILKREVTDEDFDTSVAGVFFVIAAMSAVLWFISFMHGEERAAFFLMGAIPFAGLCAPFLFVGTYSFLADEWEKAEKEAIS